MEHYLVGTGKRGEPKLYQIGEPLNTKRFKKHKKVILEFLKGKVVEFYSDSKRWERVGIPSFYVSGKYRIKSEVIYTNSATEEFTQKDFDEEIKVWWFNYNDDKLYSNNIGINAIEELVAYDDVTECFKTPEGALMAAVKHYQNIQQNVLKLLKEL